MNVNKQANPLLPGLRSTFLLSCFLVFFTMAGFSQTTVTVSGKVNLGTGSADLSGTTVQAKGAKGGVTTDATGHFSITVKSGATLVVSHVGYRSLEVKTSGQSDLSLTLETADNTLEQVTVSYGKQRKRDITGSITKVSASDVQDVPAAEFGQKLQGKVAGLQLNQTSGLPGQGMTFRVRGAASLQSGNQPLVVVDGQPINSDANGAGDINLLSPDQIESFTVLKDAAASALYGSRAANGVILITTKTGKVGKTSVSANIYYGLQSVPQRGRPDVMNAREFATFMKGYYEDMITYHDYTSATPPTIPVEYQNPEQYGKGTDWYGALLRTAPIENYAINVSGGSEKFVSSTTFNYFNQQGVLINTGMKRYSFRSNNEYKPFEMVKIGLNIAPTYQLDHNTRQGSLAINGNRQILSGAMISSPLISPHKADGSYNLSASSPHMYTLPNYVMQMEKMNNNQSNMQVLGNAYIDIEPIKGLHARSSINGDYVMFDFNTYYGTWYGAFGSVPYRDPAASTAVSSSNNSMSWLNENTVTYSKQISDHSFEALVGYTAQKFNQRSRYVQGTGFANDAVTVVSGATTTSGSTNSAAWTVASALARLNYDFRKKYFISGSIRRDGSSRFGQYTKYGTFPAVSAGWILSDEGFFPKSNTLSYLKIKGGYGLTGNFNVGNYTTISNITSTPYVFGNTTTIGESITTLGNPQLTWETSKQTDIGLEANFLNNRITLSYDYYNKRTEGMLAALPLAFGSGYASLQANIGTFRMWGHEFTVSSKNMTGKLTWTTDFNISLNDNKVLYMVDHKPIGGTGTYNDYNRTAEGHRIGELYGYVFQGLYKDQADLDKSPKQAGSDIGTVKYKDVTPDGVINISDRTFIGNTSPRMIFGISNNLTYGDWDLNIIASGQTGNKLMYINNQNLQNLDGIFNINRNMADRWRSPTNPGNGLVPRTKGSGTELYRFTNTNWVKSGDYLTIRNIALGYTFKQNTLKYIKSVRVYGSVQNAFIFTKYPNQNPEVNDNKDSQTTAGLDNGSYPLPRTIMIGANVNF
jgi:TonB-linked SusC/RagA family outer membrane protein